MRMSRLLVLLALGAATAACGGNDTREVDCKAGLEYQNRTVGKRVVVPEGLDPLEEIREMPIPAAAPEAPQPPQGQCQDMPPVIQSGG